MKDYYKILNISKDANEEAIKKSYRKLAMRYHPDKNPNDKIAEENFKNVSEAYSVLSDPQKRSAYDFGAFSPNSRYRQSYTSHTRNSYTYSQEENPFNNEDFWEDIFTQYRQQYQYHQQKNRNTEKNASENHGVASIIRGVASVLFGIILIRVPIIGFFGFIISLPLITNGIRNIRLGFKAIFNK